MDQPQGPSDHELIRLIKKNPRYSELRLKLSKGTNHVNMEEISLLNMILQFESEMRNRMQMEQAMNLTKETITLSKISVNMTNRLVGWTKWLAIATFVLASAAFLNLIIN